MKIIVLFLILSFVAVFVPANESRAALKVQNHSCSWDNSHCKNFIIKISDTGSVSDVFQLEHVINGNTIMASGKTIRLWGIDSPEKGDPLYDVAKMFLESLLKDGALTCKFINHDRYKRDVMHCLVDGADIGSMMVQMGMAEDFERYSKGYYQAEQGIAKENRRGIWKNGQSRRL